MLEGYDIQVDGSGGDIWPAVMDLFDDANIYQTRAYDLVRADEEKVSHLILKKGEDITAACKVRIIKAPVFPFSVAYVRWGPLWRRPGGEMTTEPLRMMLRALKEEYVQRRGMYLRILPPMLQTDEEYRKVFMEEGFREDMNAWRQRTMLLDLTPDTEAIRKGLLQKWRNCLHKAEKSSLSIEMGDSVELFERFLQIYGEMQERKQFAEQSDVREYLDMQRILPESHRMGVIICSEEGKPGAGAVFTGIGDMGIYLFGATNDTGMKNSGSYLIQWKIIEYLREKGCLRYNLNGVNAKVNPGSYRFKSGIAGKEAQEIEYLGQFDMCRSPLVSTAFGLFEKTRAARRRIKFGD